jgi:hypothetical protein
MAWIPSNEPLVTLACGCVTSAWGLVEIIGETETIGDRKGKRRRVLSCKQSGDESPIIHERATDDDIANCRREHGSRQDSLW